jgi:hypothetical protein
MRTFAAAFANLIFVDEQGIAIATVCILVCSEAGTLISYQMISIVGSPSEVRPEDMGGIHFGAISLF